MSAAAPSQPPPEGQRNRAAACYDIAARHPFRLFVDRGSVVDFSYSGDPQKSAIAVCYSGGDWHSASGATGAVSRAGGPALTKDLQRELRRKDCPEGDAIVTGPNLVGKLRYVIHANVRVGVSRDGRLDWDTEDRLLASAYVSSLKCGEKKSVEAIAFSLFAAGYYGPTRRLERILQIAVKTIAEFEGHTALKEVHLFAFADMEAHLLMKIAHDMGLENTLKPNPEPKKSGECQAQMVRMKVAAENEHSDDEEEASLDALAICARKAAKRLQRTITFVPRPDGSVTPGAELLCKPLSAPISDLTFQTYWRKDERSTATKSTLPTLASPDEDIDNARACLSLMSESSDDTPISLPSGYIDGIKTDTVLGKGYYGKVVLGLDHTIGRRFAIKLIEPLVIEQSLAGLCTGRLESIKKTFSNEIKVLSQLRHPNICPLLGYCMPEGGLANACLLYELAVNGSLDRFWKDTLGRERLSDARVRARIAFEVATVLRFMHEGLDGGAVCYHRDIKSANICLTADFHVRVVDCGLSKYVTEPQGSFSSAGPTGTPGYTCPEYLLGGTTFTSACDVFSFGVLLCDLITGKSSSQKSQHYLTYRKSRGARHRSLEGDADSCVDWGSGHCLTAMTKLSSKCMRTWSSERPSIGRVVRTLQQILNGLEDNCERDIDESLPSDDPFTLNNSSEELDSECTSMRCRLCGESSSKCVQCSGSQQHTHCHNCAESSLTRDINRFKYDGLRCLKAGCDSNPFPEESVTGIVSRNVWQAYSLQRRSGFSAEQVADSASRHVWNSYSRREETAMIASMETRVISLMEERFRQMHDLQVKLSAGNGLPCPKLFYLVEADAASWRNPREWAKNTGSVKLYLHFVCSHSLEPVSDKCRIKLRYSRDWLKTIAPALNLSLDLLTLALSASLGAECPLSFAKIKELDDWAKQFLGDDERSVFEEAKSRSDSDPDSGSGGSLQTLVATSLSCVAEKAASSNINWQSELVPVYDYMKKEPTFVKSRFASEPRYQGESEIVFSP